MQLWIAWTKVDSKNDAEISRDIGITLGQKQPREEMRQSSMRFRQSQNKRDIRPIIAKRNKFTLGENRKTFDFEKSVKKLVVQKIRLTYLSHQVKFVIIINHKLWFIIVMDEIYDQYMYLSKLYFSCTIKSPSRLLEGSQFFPSWIVLASVSQASCHQPQFASRQEGPVKQPYRRSKSNILKPL